MINGVQALVNLGNVKFERAAAEQDEGAREDLLLEARSLYEAATHHEPDCLEAIYNLGLAAKAAEHHDLALEQFILLNGLVPNQVSTRKLKQVALSLSALRCLCRGAELAQQCT